MVQWGERKVLKPQAVANYYEKLALVFWKAGNRLFHAAALVRLFQHYRDMKKTFGGDEATQSVCPLLISFLTPRRQLCFVCSQATRALLAVLSIAEGAGTPSSLCRYLDLEETAAANARRLSALLDLKVPPTRQWLLRELSQRLNALTIASPPVKALYK